MDVRDRQEDPPFNHAEIPDSDLSSTTSSSDSVSGRPLIIQVDDDEGETASEMTTLLPGLDSLAPIQEDQHAEEEPVSTLPQVGNLFADNAFDEEDEDDTAMREARLPSNFYGKAINLWTNLWHQNPFTLYFLVFMVVFIITSMAANGRTSCSQPVRAWLVVQAVIHVFHMIDVILSRYEVPQALSDHRRTTCYQFYLVFTRILNLVWIGWIAVGMYIWFKAFHLWAPPSECWKNAPLASICMTSAILCNIAYVAVLLSFGSLYITCYYLCCPTRPLDLIVSYVPVYKGASDFLIEDTTQRTSFAVGSMSSADAVCAVCLLEYESGQELRVLPCRHHFHQACIDVWLRKNKTCATCRQEIDRPSNTQQTSVDSV
jgi:hypothetical protein